MVVDSFLEKVFYCGKIVAGIVMALAVLAMALSIFPIISTPSRMSAPRLRDLPEKPVAEDEANSGAAPTEPALHAISERHFRTKYDKEVAQILDYCWTGQQIGKKQYDNSRKVLEGWIYGYEVDEAYRDLFVEGLLDCYKDAYSAYLKSNKTKMYDGPYIANEYHALFRERVLDVLASKAKAAERRRWGMMVFGGALSLIISFMIIPLLIKIEESSRRIAQMQDALQSGQRTGSGEQCGINADISRFLPVMLRQETVLNHILDELKAARSEKSASRDVDGRPIACPNCGCEIVIPESVVRGQHVRCPRCGTKFAFNPA